MAVNANTQTVSAQSEEKQNMQESQTMPPQLRAARLGKQRIVKTIILTVTLLFLFVPLVSMFLFTIRHPLSGKWSFDPWIAIFTGDGSALGADLSTLWSGLGASLALCVVTVLIMLVLIEVRMTNGNNEIIIANRNGRAIRFHEAAVRVMGRTATGVRGITLDNDGQDEVVGMICIKDLKTESVMVVSEQGYGKRSEIEDYRKTNRGGKGVKTMNITEKTGKLVTIKSVTDENDLMIINKSGITIRLKVADVRIMGRATQGVRLINLEKRNDQIGSVCKVMTESLEDEIPAEEAEGTIVSDPNADVPDIDDAADVNENESNNEIEE